VKLTRRVFDPALTEEMVGALGAVELLLVQEVEPVEVVVVPVAHTV